MSYPAYSVDIDRDQWKADRKRMLDLIGELTDRDPCSYDHHGYCQSHCLDEKPCPHERAKDLLREHDRLPKEER